MINLREGDSRWLLPLFALAHVAIFAGLFRGVYSMPYSGTGLYYDYAGKVLAGQLAYRDFPLEYPPLALVFFTLPRVLGESFRWYYVWFQAEVIAFDLLALGILYAAARRASLPPLRILAAYTFLLLAVGPITLQQYDIFPATLMLAAVAAFAAEQHVAAGACLALGVMTKVYPILIAPIFVLIAWRRREVIGLWRGTAAFAATCAVCLVPWLIAAPTSLSVLVNYHTQRGIHLDSSYATLAFLGRALGLGTIDIVFAFASWNIAGPLANLLARASTFILLAVLIWVFAIIDRRIRREPASARGLEFVAHASALVVVASMAASKVLSPQYLVWPVPFLALVTAYGRRAIWATFAAAGIVTYYMYPYHYAGLLDRSPGAVAMMGARNGLLIVLAIMLGRSLIRSMRERDAVRDLPTPETSAAYS